MRARPPTPEQILAEWLTRRPHDFHGEYAQYAIGGLLEYAHQARVVEAQHRDHRARWTLLPEDARRIACRRQVAALAARMAMRNGMVQATATAWVIDLAGMTRSEFLRSCDEALRNGDRLFVWQWRELRALGLTDDFMGRRQLDMWLELEEPWLTDERWVYPLHLVDKAALAQCDQQPNPSMEARHATA